MTIAASLPRPRSSGASPPADSHCRVTARHQANRRTIRTSPARTSFDPRPRETYRLKRALACAILCCFATVNPGTAAEAPVDIRELGAVPDGKTLCTKALQKAIDGCHLAGGGTVTLPPGVWVSGTIHLKSNVTFYLQPGSTLLGSADIKDFPENLPRRIRSASDTYVRQSLIAAEDAENIAIRGRGTIDGNGASYSFPEWKNRPFVIRLVGCKDVLVEDVNLRNSPMWMQHYLACDRLSIRGVRVVNHVSYNNDGMDIDGCRDVTVSDCIIDSDDDGLCLKATSPRSCENITITNCIVSSHCNALKFGTESTGGCRNVTVTNCTIRSPDQPKVFCGSQRGLAGIALEIVDGGTMDRVTVSNITIDGVSSPIFLRLGNRAKPYMPEAPAVPVGTLRNILLSNIVATHASKVASSIMGIPGHPVENVTLSNIRIETEGGGTAQDLSREVPEKEKSYPECTMFGALPAYGLYGRHVRNLRLFNVQLSSLQPDARPATKFVDAEDVRTDNAQP